jgi:hypothetical protein
MNQEDVNEVLDLIEPYLDQTDDPFVPAIYALLVVATRCDKGRENIFLDAMNGLASRMRRDAQLTRVIRRAIYSL